MSTTPNLLIAHVAAAQNNKEVTLNTGLDDFDGAVTDLLAIAMTTSNYTMSTGVGGEALGHLVYTLTGAIGAARNLIVPINKKLYIVSNQTSGGFAVTVKTLTGTGIALNTTAYVILYCDGTNVIQITAASGAITEADLSLSDVTTDNVSITKHGFAPKAPNDVSQFLDGTGSYSVPGGTTNGGVLVKTADYTAVGGDKSLDIVGNSAAAHTLTLPAAPPSSTWFIRFKNINTGVWTISRNSLTIDGLSRDLTIGQGDSVDVYTDGTNYFTAAPRSFSFGIFMKGIGANSDVLFYAKLGRTVIFPASAPNALGVAGTAATGSTTYTFKKNGASFATAVFSAAGTTAAWTQASDAVFTATDILEIDGPATADATLANMGLTLQGYKF